MKMKFLEQMTKCDIKQKENNRIIITVLL